MCVWVEFKYPLLKWLAWTTYVVQRGGRAWSLPLLGFFVLQKYEEMGGVVFLHMN